MRPLILKREGPLRRVDVRGFAIGKHEVTQAQWRTVVGNNPSSFTICGDDCPVESVSWEDIQEYLRQLNKKISGRDDGPYRLPSEAEWEYAARAGTHTSAVLG